MSVFRPFASASAPPIHVSSRCWHIAYLRHTSASNPLQKMAAGRWDLVASLAVDADTRRRLTIFFDQPETMRCRARWAQTPELHTNAASSLVLMCAIALVYVEPLEPGTG